MTSILQNNMGGWGERKLSMIIATQHYVQTNQSNLWIAINEFWDHLLMTCIVTPDKSSNNKGTVVSCILWVQHLYLSVSVWLTVKKEKKSPLVISFKAADAFRLSYKCRVMVIWKQWMKTSWVKKRRTKKKHVKSPLKTNTKTTKLKV